MRHSRIVVAALCAIGGAAVAALLMQHGRSADENQVSALERRIGALETQIAAPQASIRVPGAVEMPGQSARPPGAHDHTESRSSSRTDAMPEEQAAPAFADAAAAAERRRYESGLF